MRPSDSRSKYIKRGLKVVTKSKPERRSGSSEENTQMDKWDGMMNNESDARAELEDRDAL
jgi:hypothetical protein